MPINIKNMKGLDFSCTSPASTAICSSTDQRYMVKNTTKSLTRLNSYLNDHYKNFTNNNIINTNNYSFSPRAPCISELPFTPRLSSSYREKTRKKPPSSSVVKHSDLTTPRRNSSVDIAEVRRRYYDKCTYNGSCSPPHSHSSRYLLGESKFLDSLHESSHHQSKITKNRKFSNSNNDDDALALIPSTPILSKEAHETKSFGSFLDAEKDNKKISKSLVLVNNNSSDRNDIKSNNKVDYDGINQRQKSMGYGRNDSLVVKKSSSSGARSRDQVVVLRVSLHCKGCRFITTSSSAPSLPRFFSTSTASASALSAIDDPTIPQPQHQGKQQRGTWSKMFLFLPGAITFGLGSWQIIRRQDKIKTLDYRRERLAMEPIEFNDIASGENSNTLEFRRVVCRGAFDEKKSIYVGPRSRSISGVTENGYYIITPLVPISGNLDSVQSPVLVNRGWVPRSWRDKALESSQGLEEDEDVPSTASSSGEIRSFWRFWSKKPQTTEELAPSVTPVEVIGVIRGSEKPSIFVPENDPASGQWFFVDVPAIAHASGLPQNTVYIEDINDNVSASNPYPVPKDASTLIRSSVMPQDHLNYTLTWYSLSAAVTYMAYKRLKPRKIRR